MDNRQKWIDQARGIALLLVVLGHMGIPYFGQFFTTVHLPLFFFLSGITFSEKPSFGVFLNGKVKRLLIPYLCLGIPLVLVSFATRMMAGITDPADYLRVCLNYLLQRRWCTIWFLTCLFLTSILLYVLINCLRKRSGLVLLASLGLSILGVVYWELGGVALPWNLDACFVAILFMAIGYYARNKGLLENEKNFSSWGVFLLSALLYLACVSVNGFVVHEKFDIATMQTGFAPLTLLGTTCGIYCIVFISKRFSFGRILEYLGQNTMVYFAWHQSIVLPILLWAYCLLGRFTIDTLVSDLLRTFLTVVLIFVLLYPFDLLFRKTKLRFAVGK